MASNTKRSNATTQDLLARHRQEIEDRLAELKPAYDEYNVLLGAVGRGPTKVKSAPSNGNGRGRPRGTGQRAQQVVDDVTSNPGATVAEVAERLGIKPNYLYRVMPELVKEGRLVRNSDGTYAVAVEQPAEA